MALRTTNVKVIAFDLYGTLANLNSIADRCCEITSDGEAFFSAWRSKQLEYTYLTTLMGRYRDFADITARSLDYLLAQRAIAISAEKRQRLLDSWNAIAAYPDVLPALEALTEKYPLAILSNGSPQMLASGLKAAALSPYFRFVLSAHSVRAYKPSPRVYELAVKRTQQTKGKILFVSSNSWDVAGAKSFGLKVCWVNRNQTNFDKLGFEPDLTVKNLLELVEKVGLSIPAS